jgi:hypothetical protein
MGGHFVWTMVEQPKRVRSLEMAAEIRPCVLGGWMGGHDWVGFPDRRWGMKGKI